MKKSIFIILTIMLTCIIMLSACDSPDGVSSDNIQQPSDENRNNGGGENTASPNDTTVCDHSFGDWDTVKQATCAEEGKRERACLNCAKVEEEIIQRSETHSPVTDKAVAPSCKNTGLTEGSHCSVCGKIFVAQATVPKTDDHTPVTDKAVAPTCKNTGLTEGSHCSVCDKVFVAQETVPKTDDHTPVTDKAVAPSCKNTGLTEGSHCSVCKKIFTAQVTIPKKPHNYVNRYCDSCGEKQVSSGLKFEYYDGYASVSGIGSCTDTVIIIPDKAPTGVPVKEIATEAFMNCVNIVEVIIPDAVSYIGSEAFMNCSSLERITLPSAYTDMALQTFANCTSLKEITIPNKVFRIGLACFENCTALEKVVIPSSVTTYSKDAFNGCAIKDLYISSLEVWCNSIFYSTTANPLHCAENLYLQQDLVTTLELNRNICGGAFIGYDKLTKVVLGNGVKSVGPSAFYGCDGLTEVVFGNGIETIDKSAFYNCTKLNSVNLPSSLKTISSYAFYGCSDLHTVTVSNGLQSLGDHAFSECSLLRKIDLPSSVTYIGISPFEKCASLESITIPFVGVSTRGGQYEAFGSLFGSTQYDGGEMVTQIKGSIGTQGYEYSYCIPKALKHVKLLNYETTSTVKVFVNCKYIESITLGKGVTGFGVSSISGCTALTDIYYEGTKDEWKNLRYSEQFNSVEAITVTCSDGVIEKT